MGHDGIFLWMYEAQKNLGATIDFLIATVCLGTALIRYSITKRKGFTIYGKDDIPVYTRLEYVEILHYKNTSYFNTFETRRDNHNGSYGFPIHISVIRSESVELLRLLLKIDPKLTKKKLYRDGENPLASLCQKPKFPTQFKMVYTYINIYIRIYIYVYA
jgi:hypothetical protein